MAYSALVSDIVSRLRMTSTCLDDAHELPLAFEHALANLPDGYLEGRFADRSWGLTINRSSDGKRVWLYAHELGGADVISFNLYRLSKAGPVLKPCEMSSVKVIGFVLGFEPWRVGGSLLRS